VSRIDPNRILAVVAAILIAGCLLGNLAFYGLDQSIRDGYDHACYNSLLAKMHEDAPGVGNTIGRGHPDPNSLIYLTLAPFAGFFGPSDRLLSAIPLLGYALMIWFAFLIGRRIGDRALTGWLAAAMVALSPYSFALSLRFNPWPLTLALYLAILHAALVYRERPRLHWAALLGFWTALGTASAHEPTSHLLFIAFAAPVILWALLSPILGSETRARTAAASAAGIYVIVTRLLPNKEYDLFSASTLGYLRYLQDETAITAGKISWTASLPGFFLDAWFNTLGPVGTVVVIGLALSYFAIRPKKPGTLLLALGPVFFLALSVVPKKNGWYMLEPLALLSIAAGVGLGLWIVRQRLIGLAVALAVLIALWFQYAEGLFGEPVIFPAKNYPVATLTRYLGDAPRLVYPAQVERDRLKPRIEQFASRFKQLFPGDYCAAIGLISPYREFEEAEHLFIIRACPDFLSLQRLFAIGAETLWVRVDAVLAIPVFERVGPSSEWAEVSLEALFDEKEREMIEFPGIPEPRKMSDEQRAQIWATLEAGKIRVLPGDLVLITP
jgi:hypothetical protein